MKTIKLSLLAIILTLGLCKAHAQAGNPCNSSPSNTYRYSQNIVVNSITAAGATQIIPAPSASYASIRICAYDITVSETATPATWGLVAGQGSNCVTNQVWLTSMYPGSASATLSDGKLYTGAVLSVPPMSAVCLNLGGTVTYATVHILYVVL